MYQNVPKICINSDILSMYYLYTVYSTFSPSCPLFCCFLPFFPVLLHPCHAFLLPRPPRQPSQLRPGSPGVLNSHHQLCGKYRPARHTKATNGATGAQSTTTTTRIHCTVVLYTVLYCTITGTGRQRKRTDGTSKASQGKKVNNDYVVG